MKKLFSLLFMVAVLVFVGCQNSTPGSNNNNTELKLDVPSTITPLGELSKLESIDDQWNLYTNSNLGFSLKVPVKVVGIEQKLEPMDIIEDSYSGIVTIINPSDINYTKVKTNAANELSVSIEDKVEGIVWAITVLPAGSDADLNAFIKQRYGADCVGEVFRTDPVTGYLYYTLKDSKGNPASMTSLCPLNAAFALIYSPTDQKLATWGLGNGGNYWPFSADSSYYDKVASGEIQPTMTLMYDNFRFVKYN